MQTNIWKSLGFIGHSAYEISENGDIKNVKRTVLKTKKNAAGYLAVSLSTNNKKQTFTVHTLVAKAYLPNPENKATVDHIDRNRENSKLSNLRWADVREQCKNRIMNKNPKSGRKIQQLDDNFKVIKTWDKFTDACKEYGWGKQSNVSRAIEQRIKCAGYYWRYVDSSDFEKEIWKPIPMGSKYPKMSASKTGKIRFDNTGIIKTGYKTAYGYLLISIVTNKGRKIKYLHRLIAYAFFGEEKRYDSEPYRWK